LFFSITDSGHTIQETTEEEEEEDEDEDEDDEMPFYYCETCVQELHDPKRCGKCERAYYCSKKCQKIDWKIHKPTCARPPNVNTMKEPTNMQEAVSQLLSMSLDDPGRGDNRTIYLEPQRLERVKAIGRMLGSYDAMLEVANRVQHAIPILNRHMDSVELLLAWDKINGWPHRQEVKS
jgi:hypothetical protein